MSWDLVKDLLENKIILAIMYLAIGYILIKIIDFIAGKYKKKRGTNIKASFTKSVIQALITIAVLFKIASMSEFMQNFSNTILMSSSLIVVILGFVFQEGLSNIVHGFIITIFKPFEVGDRIQISAGGETITGYVKNMTLRHTTIANIADNAECIIPNSVLDNSTIRNLTMQDSHNRYPLTVSISYEQAADEEKLLLAQDLIREEILANPRTIDKRLDKSKPMFVNVALNPSTVDLTCFLETNTPEDNYFACSEVRQALLKRFAENGISFAYNHLDVTLMQQERKDEIVEEMMEKAQAAEEENEVAETDK